MNLYYDSEFTGLTQDTSLISLALVSDADHSFYAEFSDYHRHQIDDWLRDNVLAHCRWQNATDYFHHQQDRPQESAALLDDLLERFPDDDRQLAARFLRGRAGRADRQHARQCEGSGEAAPVGSAGLQPARRAQAQNPTLSSRKRRRPCWGSPSCRW